MAEVVTISTYQYYSFAARDGLKAVAICASADGKRVSVFFDAGEKDLPAARKLNDSQYLIYYRYSDYPVIIDMLRNEKPIFFIYQPEGTNNSRLSTSSEPVGEGEDR